MRPALQRLVDVRPGEAARVLHVGAALFAIIAGHTLLETARDSLFLQALPVSRLAVVYAVMAGLALVTVPLGAALVRRLGRRDALVVSLTVAAAGTAILYTVPAGDAAVFALYLWTGVIASTVVVQLWLVAGQRFTLAEGKRLLGVIAAVGALGAFTGAALASALVVRVDVRHLLPVAAGLFASAAAIVRALPVLTRAPTAPADASAPPVAPPPRGYLRRLALLVVLATATVLVTDYLFKSAVTRAIAPADLPAFFARYGSVVTALSLLIQVVGAGALIRRTGVVAALTVLPVLLLAGVAGEIAFPGAFVAVLIAKGADGVLRHSLHRMSLELLWMPVPAELRDHAKEPVDGVLVRAIQALTAGGLFALAVAGADTPTMLALVVGGLALAWLVTAVAIRRPYLDQFRQALARPSFTADAVELDLDAVELVVEAMASPDPRQVRAAIASLAGRGRSRLVPALVLLHDDDGVLLDALTVIATPDRRDWRALGARLLVHRSLEVRVEALRALARAGALDLRPACDDDATLRGHVGFWLAQGGGAGPRAEHPCIAAILADDSADGDEARAALLDAIGGDGDASWTEVVVAILGADPDRSSAALVPRALAAMARTPDPRFVPALIERLAVRRERPQVRAALVGLGALAQSTLEGVFLDPATPPRIRLALPAAIAAFADQRAADFLVGRMAVRGALGFQVLRALTRLAASGAAVRIARPPVVIELAHNLREHFRLLAVDVALDAEPAALIRGLLRDKRDQALERAFMLLQIVRPREDLRAVRDALTRGDRVERGHALELLDGLSRRLRDHHPDGDEARRLLLLIADELPDHERLGRAGLLGAPRDRHGALADLLADADPTVVALAAHHAGEVGAARWPRAAQVVAIAPGSELLYA